MNSVPLASDKILISDLRLHACVGEDRWRKRRPQPIKLSATLSVDLAQAGRTDSIASTVNYGTLCRQLLEKSDGKEYAHLRQMAMDSIALVLEKPGVVEATMEVEAMNQFLLADCVGVRLRRWKDNTPGGSYDEAYIKNLQLNVLIGVNPPEREFKQVVVTNISFVTPTWKAPDWLGMHDALVKAIESASFLTLEAFVTNIARVACFFEGAGVVVVKAQKPSALVHAGSSGVEITRSRAFFQDALESSNLTETNNADL